MIARVTTARIWAQRKQQTAALARATKKREQPGVELTNAEWRLLHESARLEAEVRGDAEKRNRK